MAEKYESFDQRNYESVYLHTGTIIEHPIEKVWPHALNIGKWMSAHGLETVAGEPGKVGHFERVFPRGLSEDLGQPRYHLYGVAEIIPFQLIALEVLPERGGSYGNTREWMSFDSIIFTDLGQRTKLTFHMIDVHLGKGGPDFQKQKKAELEEAGGRLLTQYFENLKQLVAAGP